MDTQSVTNWVQVATGIAVLIGLGFVAYELNQTREIAQAQLHSEGFFAHQSREIAEMGEQPAHALSKAWCEPSELTTEEMLVLDSYFRSILLVNSRVNAMVSEYGFFEQYDISRSVNQLREVFLTPYGRYWWSSVSSDMGPELARVGDTMLETFDPLDYSMSTCSSWTEGYFKYLADEEADERV